MSIAPIALLGGLIYALTTFARRVFPVKVDGWKAQLLSFVVGLGTVFLVSASSLVGTTFKINGIALNDLDFYSKVILGLLATGLFATVPNDLFKAIDNNRDSTPK